MATIKKNHDEIIPNVDIGESGTAGTLDVFPSTASKGKIQIAAVDNTNNDTLTITNDAHGQATSVTIPDAGLATSYLVQSTAALTAAETDVLDGATPGTVVASKAVVVDANKDIGDFRNLDVINLDAGSSGTAGTVECFPATPSKGKLVLQAKDNAGNSTLTIQNESHGQATVYIIGDTGISGNAYFVTSTAKLTAAEADVLDGAVQGTAGASKAVVLDGSLDITGINDVSLAGLTSSDVAVSSAVVTDGSSKLAASSTTATEIGYVSGVTSSIQEQIEMVESSSPGVGVLFYMDDDVLIATGANNDNVLNELFKTPQGGAEIPVAISCASNTVLGEAYKYDTDLNILAIAAGEWTFDTYGSVSSVSGGRVSSITRNIYLVKVGTGTLTVTGSDTTRTATASSGSPFTGTDDNADIALCGYVETPLGLYAIPAYTSPTIVSITTPSVYTNETTVAYSVWKYQFSSSTGTITHLTTDYGPHVQKTIQTAITSIATDKLAEIVFGISNNTTTVNFVHNGTVNYSHFHSTLANTHNDMVGLNDGEFKHLTSSEYAEIPELTAWADNVTLNTDGSITQESGAFISSDQIKTADTTTATTGIIFKAADRWLHNFHHPTGGAAIPAGKNVFLGIDSGNFTIGSTAATTGQGSYNVCVGEDTLKLGTTASQNVIVGTFAGDAVTVGNNCVALGYNSLSAGVSVQYDLAIGTNALTNCTANDNVGVGYTSLLNITSGASLVAIGSLSGRYIANGSTSNITSLNSVYVGYGTKAGADGNTNETVIGYNAIGGGNNTVVLGDANVVNIMSGSDDVCDLGKIDKRFDDIYATNATIQTSDKRFKRDIEPLENAGILLTALRPVLFKWKDYDEPAVKKIVEVQKENIIKHEDIQKTIVFEDGKYIQKETKKYTETKDLVFEKHPLYNEAGDIIGEHEVPVMVKRKKEIKPARSKTHHRTHCGLIAQEVESTLAELGIDSKDFAALVYDPETDRYAVRYTELIPVLINGWQEQQKLVEKLAERITELEKK